jgi:hypothetical protein
VPVAAHTSYKQAQGDRAGSHSSGGSPAANTAAINSRGSNAVAGVAAPGGSGMAAGRGPTQDVGHNQRLAIHRAGGPARTRASSRVDALQALGIPVKLAIRKPGGKQSRAPAGPVGGCSITSGAPFSLSSMYHTLVLFSFLVPFITAT